MILVDMLKSLRHHIGKRYHVGRTLFEEYQFLLKTLGTCDTDKSQNKQRELIIMQTHVIEKGLSLKDVRFGFGISKIISLLKQLEFYYHRYHDKETLFFVLSVIEAYISFHVENNQEVHTEILNHYSSLVEESPSCEERLRGGIIHMTKTEVIKSISEGFEAFARSRHSQRQFTGNTIDVNLLEKAFEIAETTPSACNRQPWHNYVFTKKEDIVKILDIQRGARQFKDDVSALIIVCATPNAFMGMNEYHQHFVNGGLYAMNLLYAIHSQGLGAIPLNGGVGKEKSSQILSMCEGSDQDELILLIAVGEMPDEFNVAKSARFSFTNYTKFI